ncbi:L-2-amino-thiazoline-4-carboxylic acid hydrolase [Desulfovibrio inopinatus]|uniref:L-2-amino-thiazoline-4-carboxylic acid hydrolase n=1 Tax=Desulfovibrio inopinatus TaxID=102109 RepID=UPI00042882AA|nr:L-2-amino-thiazoline-4-carboxylic acid hydrolase [Desulfovibrio inopinatus]
MKNIFRKLIGIIVVLPFVIAIKTLSIFMSQQKAIEKIGPIVTVIAKQTLKYWVPTICVPNEFDAFPQKMKRNFKLWRLFYDIEVSEENSNVFKLFISNCPFCEALNSFGFPNLSAYICEGDWAIAHDNSDKWIFERAHQIGTGDSFCDHTYKRIQL